MHIAEKLLKHASKKGIISYGVIPSLKNDNPRTKSYITFFPFNRAVMKVEN